LLFFRLRFHQVFFGGRDMRLILVRFGVCVRDGGFPCSQLFFAVRAASLGLIAPIFGPRDFFAEGVTFRRIQNSEDNRERQEQSRSAEENSGCTHKPNLIAMLLTDLQANLQLRSLRRSGLTLRVPCSRPISRPWVSNCE